MISWPVAWGVLALGTMSACASAPVAHDGERGAPSVVIDGRTGLTLSAQEVDERLRVAQVILVGEEHANPLFHAVQAEVLARVARLSPQASLAIEWLPASKSLAVTRFLESTPPTSLDELRQSVAWDEVWGHDFTAYAPLFEAARRLHVPVFPINAEPGLARFVARGGVDAVPPERRAELPPLDTGNEAHRSWFRERMEAASQGHAHAVEGDALERFYLAQLVWDETMARNVRVAAAIHKVVVFAGLGHVENGLGIPARLGDLERLVIIPITSLGEVHARDVAMPEREADLYWLGSASPLTGPRSPSSR